jgi:hypothetical protein
MRDARPRPCATPEVRLAVVADPARPPDDHPRSGSLLAELLGWVLAGCPEGAAAAGEAEAPAGGAEGGQS